MVVELIQSSTDPCRQLSDTTKSGRLMFPEFALAMYLCNLQLTGKSLPDKVPERIMNEVSSMVDIISFGVPDSQPTRETPRSNVPNFEVTPSQTGSQPAPAPGPRPSESNIQTLATLSAQPTGYMPPSGFGSISAQGSLSAPGSFAAQGTGYGPPQRMSPQPTLQPTRTGFQPTPSNLGIGAQFTGVQTPPRGNSLIPPNALQSQPTGRPGQWGFVSAPAGSLAGIQALQAQLMPQPGREGAFSSAGLQGTANVPWAITKDEKT
jgi:actin cytoskeleton-regulatory complex protein PAN1